MTLVNELKTRLTTAMKAKNETEKSIIRVVLGELATAQGRTGKESTDDDVKRVVRKLIQSNTETIGGLEGDRRDTLVAENEILTTFVPAPLSQEDIKNRIMLAGAPIYSQIREAKSDGQAVGACIKYLKGYNWEANGEDVKAVVQELRK